jgi:hypothetical protein
MFATLDIVTDIAIVLCGVVAIIYGYWRWSYYHENKDKWWYVIGSLMLIGVLWGYVSKHMFVSIDYQTLFWSRNLVAAVAVVACIAIYYRFRLE